MKKIYIVGGSTGEYSDRSEWVVCAYTNESDAQAHVTKATEYAKAWEAFLKTDECIDMDWSDKEAAMKKANPVDPAFDCDYTGTRYTYWAVELLDGFTTPERIN